MKDRWFGNCSVTAFNAYELLKQFKIGKQQLPVLWSLSLPCGREYHSYVVLKSIGKGDTQLLMKIQKNPNEMSFVPERDLNRQSCYLYQTTQLALTRLPVSEFGDAGLMPMELQSLGIARRLRLVTRSTQLNKLKGWKNKFRLYRKSLARSRLIWFRRSLSVSKWNWMQQTP